MKTCFAGVAVCLLIVTVFATEKKIEDLSATEILQKEEYFNIYSNCILDKGECTPDATAVKGRIEDGFKDGCTRCTKEEKDELKVIFQYLAEKKPDTFKLLTEKYDSDGSKKNNYSSLLS